MDIRQWNERNAAISKKYDSVYHRLAQKYGFSDLQHWILYHLYSTGRQDCTQNTLAAEFCMPKQSVNSACARLRDMGYIALTPCSGANKKVLALTEEGIAACEKCVRPLLEAEKRVIEKTPHGELELYLGMLERRYEILYGEIAPLLETENE